MRTSRKHPSFEGPDKAWQRALPALRYGVPRNGVPARFAFLPMCAFPAHRSCAWLLALLALPAAPAPAEDRAPLDTAAAVLSLPAEQAAARLPIRVTGVVTAAEGDWNGQFFLQDETGGVFVENLHAAGPRPGDRVTVTGVSHPGAFAPIISAPRWEKLGTAALPPARPVPIEELESGVDDGLRVEIEGVVRAVRPTPARTTLDLAVGGHRLQVCAPPLALGRPDALVAARVRVRGTTATHYNAALRHLTSVAVYVPSWDEFTVLQPEAADPFAEPAISLNGVAQYRRSGGPARRLHVRGTVTHQLVGEALFLQDPSGGLRIESTQTDAFALGEQVEAVGFLEYENHLPLLRDAAVRRMAAPRAPLAPRAVTVGELRLGLHHASLITLRGRILDRAARPVARPAAGFSGVNTTWLLQGDGLTFTAECETREEGAPALLAPVGSVVELDGVAVSDVDTDGKLQTLKLLLPSPSLLRVVARPSWFTAERLLVLVALVSAVLLAVVGWLLTVSKKNSALRAVIREREQAQRELQEAHDTLEQKVAERSAQLQIEMTARRTAELQFKAVLSERTRLARDLHDTLEQTLTGIGLQLDTAARLFESAPEQCQRHLQLARNWLQQSQVGLRRSIWDLRSRELEQFDLPRALQQSGEQLVAGTDVKLDFSVAGERRALPEIVEENVLRIGQEAFTNIAKHARAKNVRATLQFSPTTLRLRIEDDGAGFSADRPVGTSGEHFGVIGMSERAKRLGGHVALESAPGRGTVVQVEIPLEPVDSLPPPTNPSLDARP